MEIRELRIRYELFTANGFPIIHAIVCTFPTLAVHVRRIREVGYRIVGIDERFRDQKIRMELDEGWKEISNGAA